MSVDRRWAAGAGVAPDDDVGRFPERHTMDFTLTDAAGKPVSTASARSESYAGSDTAGMALTLIEERAGEVVARLYSDYCRNAR